MGGVSHPEGKDWALSRYRVMLPSTVLDVGPGQGVYAQTFRPRYRGYWTALEIHEPYVERFGLRHLYDEVIIGDARDLPPRRFDLIILGDVVEHVVKDEGVAMLRSAMQRAGAVLLSIPLGEYVQGEIDGNGHETHLATWQHEDVLAALGECDHWIGTTVGVYWWRSPSSSRGAPNPAA